MNRFLRLNNKAKFLGLALLFSLFSLSQPVFAIVDYEAEPNSASRSNVLTLLEGESARLATKNNCPYKIGGFLGDCLVIGQRILNDSTKTPIAPDWDSYQCIEEKLTTAQANGQSYIKVRNQQMGLGGALKTASYQILDQRPASGVIFAVESFDKVVNPSSVLADPEQPYFPGQGWDLLAPIQSFWGWAVTVSYSLMIIIILVVAFALLFRARLNGGQVVQIQNAIPNIVLAMILIPLSYPISGLFIDAIAVGTNVVHDAFFSESGPARQVYEQGSYSGTELPQAINAENSRGLYADDPRLSWLNVRGLMSFDLADGIFTDVKDPECLEEGVSCVANLENDSIASTITNGVMDFLDGAIATLGHVINFVMSIIIIVVSAKILWRLLKKFLVIMIIPMISPFVCATIALPGVGTNGLGWFVKNLGAASLAFITTYTMFLLSIIFISSEFHNSIPGIQTATYSPPLLFYTPNDQNRMIDPGFIFVILGLGIFLAIPSMLDALDKALGVEFAVPELVRKTGGELLSSADIAFRQIPGVGRTVAGRFGSGFAATTSSLIGERRSDGMFSQSNAVRGTEWMRGKVAGMRGSRLAQNRVTGGIVNAGITGLAKGVGDPLGRLLTGKAGEISQGGEEAFDYEAKIDLGTGQQAVNSPGSGFLQFTASQLGAPRSAGGQVPAGHKVPGKLILSTTKGSPALYGVVYLRELESGGVISKMKRTSKPHRAPNSDDLKLKLVKDFSSAGKEAVKMDKNPAGVTFVQYDVQLEFPSGNLATTDSVYDTTIKTCVVIDINGKRKMIFPKISINSR